MEEEREKKNEEPKVIYRGVKTMPLIIGNETFEKLGTIGTSHNLLVYMTTVFNLSSVTATTLINIFHGTTNFATLPGAFLCDTFFGRYKTLGFASVASFLGMVILTLTAAIPILRPPKCNAITLADASTCVGPTAWQLMFLLASLALLVIGAGGIRPCNLAFGVDQFNPNTESGKRGIDSFFNWYYFTFTFAMMISLTLIVYVQSEVSWTWGLGIPASLMLLSCVLFFAGTRIYVKVRAAGSPLSSAARVLVAAVKKRDLKSPERPWDSLYNHVPAESYNSKLPYTGQFKFLDKAAIIESAEEINPDGSARDPWRLASMQQVEEMKVVMRVIPIWSSIIIYYLAVSMQSTYVVFQALQADRSLKGTKFHVPAGSFSVFSMLSLTLFVPIYDRAIVPALRRLTGKPSGITILQRMGCGMGLALIALVMSGLVEDRRRALARLSPIGMDPRHGAISSFSSMWLIPQLTLTGVSEAFTLIAHIEFYYKQFPENMRSIGGSFSFLGFGLSNYLSGFLVSVVHRATAGSGKGNWLSEDLNTAKLDMFYYMLAALGAANFAVFLLFSRWYKYKESSIDASGVEMEDLPSEKSIV